MESYYMIMIGVLFILAITDLIVGVSNDAVNFLNSAIGSKAYTMRVIMIVASVGVLAGSVSSSGMMEVARKGVFMPGMFQFDEIIILFMAVMITDVLLLDLFNTLGLPTSTTVSIVFELLGASVAMALIKINNSDAIYIEQLGEFINTGKALMIISGILLSVVFAFSIGAIVQYLSRLLFSFQFEKNVPYFGALFGGFAITAILYFIIIKGIKGTPFYGDVKHILDNYLFIGIVVSFIAVTVICQLLYKLFHFNILKFIILIGTFSLAMAFAGNDLVNFIGVPIAAFQSFEQWVASGVPASEFSMEGLAGKVPTPTLFLILAGGVMVLTLWFSKKARAVVATGVNLSRQGDGTERFHPNAFSRGVVRISIGMGGAIKKAVPDTVLDKMENRFEQKNRNLSKEEMEKEPAFDLIRASVNLVVAGILISIGTSLKLPLSTTYVTFMVAMGTSLADRAWNRESAVYRIAGVVNVIGGWFLTALVAFSASALIAYIIHLGQAFGGELGMLIVVIVLALIAGGIIIYGIFFKKNTSDEVLAMEDLAVAVANKEEFIAKATRDISSILKHISDIYGRSVKAFVQEDLKMLKKVTEKAGSVDRKAKGLRDNVHHVIHDLNAVSLETGNHYVQVADYLREIGHSISFIVDPMKQYLANNHKPFNEEQADELRELGALIHELYEDVKILASNSPNILDDEELEIVQDRQEKILAYLTQIRKKQIKRIKKNIVGTRNSMLYLSILNETKNLVLQTGNVVKSLRDFFIASSEAFEDELNK
ncbi:phosphate transporter family protein [Balneicella halophila]|uniref:Phosphate transporter n=1 Tax=Balneicella halophila TaxID=1537566 RepID=A0A7L4URR9_BALHA|nr:inorganic phosphate transporter [Balneicella halophila]PVX51917.1 phosphate transporter family protein [Balneicella halophila]